MSQQTINTPRDTTLKTTENTPRNIADVLADELSGIATAIAPSIANDYDELVDKPQINGVTLSGNKTAKQLGIRQTIPMNSAAYALLSSAEKMDPDKDYIITDANAVNVPVDDNDISINKVWSSKKTDDTKADKEAILQTVEECEASTDPDDIAGAAVVSTLNSNIPTLYSWSGTSGNAAFRQEVIRKGTDVQMTIIGCKCSYSDGASIYPSALVKPTATSYLLGVLRLSDGKCVDGFVGIDTSGNMTLSAYQSIGSASITGINVTGHFTTST